jgi:hypothetical protein
MKDTNKSFLGKGWAFPPSFSKFNHNIDMVKDDEDIEQSIQIILGTIPGERIMYPSFGCGIHKYVFESMDATHMTMLKDTVYDALLYHEPRITDIKIEVRIDKNQDGLIRILIDYKVIVTNSRSNMVFPFYIKEGTNL